MVIIMDYTQIIMSFVLILAAFALSLLMKWIRSIVSDSTWNSAVSMVELAVAAAEQMFKGIPKSGEEKYRYVYDMLDTLNINDTEKNMLIEAAVKKLK